MLICPIETRLSKPCCAFACRRDGKWSQPAPGRKISKWMIAELLTLLPSKAKPACVSASRSNMIERIWRARLVLFSLLLAKVVTQAAPSPAKDLPSLPEVLASKLDLWGEAAMRQPNGASFE